MTALDTLKNNLKRVKEVGQDLKKLKEEQERINIEKISERVMKEIIWIR